MNISKFEKLPDGFAYRVERGAGGSADVYVTGRFGAEFRIVGGDRVRMSFDTAPDTYYLANDVRDTLIKAALGGGEES